MSRAGAGQGDLFAQPEPSTVDKPTITLTPALRHALRRCGRMLSPTLAHSSFQDIGTHNGPLMPDNYWHKCWDLGVIVVEQRPHGYGVKWASDEMMLLGYELEVEADSDEFSDRAQRNLAAARKLLGL